MGNPLAGIAFEPGNIILVDTAGNRTSQDIASVLRALDIPTGLTYEQVGAITTLANLVVVLIRTLIAKNVLDEQFLEEGEIDLEAITETVEQMGGDYGEPDISVI